MQYWRVVHVFIQWRSALHNRTRNCELYHLPFIILLWRPARIFRLRRCACPCCYHSLLTFYEVSVLVRTIADSRAHIKRRRDALYYFFMSYLHFRSFCFWFSVLLRRGDRDHKRNLWTQMWPENVLYVPNCPNYNFCFCFHVDVWAKKHPAAAARWSASFECSLHCHRLILLSCFLRIRVRARSDLHLHS